ncbi:MAG: histidinol-phosphate transaminase [Prevotella sp.]|nr:histidinol-phosphate transaminase [Prevotella sp.]MDY4039768.1 histidinol-phosphate transaminase [Prevotella sp.]
MKSMQELVRPNILALEPYSSARNEYSGHVANVFLDANENPYNKPFNRYPDPLQTELKSKLAKIKQVPAECIFLGNGSDEAIDLVYRVFCRPGIDNVIAIDPTYGMYKTCADINDVAYRPVSLDEQFRLKADQLLQACDDHTKVIWICTPNNPSGNNMDHDEVGKILTAFEGIVVIDEAYSDFSTAPTFRSCLADFPNMIVLNTMSKAWGCAAIRLGMAFADSAIINLFNKVKYPYNVNLLTQEHALEALDEKIEVEKWVNILLQERSRMIRAFLELPICKQVYPTDANFFLARMTDAQAIYDYLVNKGIIVRNRTRVHLCQNCLRVTIGTRTENNELLAALRQY